jgi:hypothetical protein
LTHAPDNPKPRTSATSKKLGGGAGDLIVATMKLARALPLNHMPDYHAKSPHHASVTAPKTRRAVYANKRAKLLALPCFASINRNYTREHDRKSEFRFEVRNKTRNPPRRGPFPIK